MLEYHMDMDLDELKQKLLTMASHAETAVNEALRALLERDYDLALRVKEDDNVIDQLEVEIDDMAIHLLAKAPLASDLRLVTVAMKISQNLERVGDEASKIAKAALDAFVNKDPVAARALIPRDKEVDGINKQITNQLAEYMVENPDTIKRCLNLITVSRSLERIADHATNVAEEVVYLYEAQDIRHTGGKFGLAAKGNA